MAAAATASGGPRYAPPDPTLPEPWKGLVDGKTGYLYFWNPVTNVTQYERPRGIDSVPKSSSVPMGSSVLVQQSSEGRYRYSSEKENDLHGRGCNAVSKLESILGGNQFILSHLIQRLGFMFSYLLAFILVIWLSQNYREVLASKNSRGGPFHSLNAPNGTSSSVIGGSFARGQGSAAGESNLFGDAYCRQHEITVSGGEVPPPFSSFESTGFPPEILREVRYLLLGGANVVRCGALCGGLAYNLGRPCMLMVNSATRSERKKRPPPVPVHNAGFSAPTPIQAQSWPIAVQGRDIVAIAKTGSGKTLGYLLPGFMHLKRCHNDPQMGPTVLVLSPTRELATQIQDEAHKFGKSSRISCTCLYGGAPKGPQLREIERGVDIVVATPGRLNDILEMKRISLHQVSYLVLDEADRMLDMGFEPQIRKIVKEVPTRRQTLMFTATWPKEVRKIAADLLVNPVQVNIGNIDELVANKSITQYVEVLSPMEKHRRLEQILRSQEPGSKII
ncbi:hypothetical protein Golob_002280, partial [Gossypium lobatum]|nr:hypothetical protein [Gossypium lobatum]